MALVQDNVQGNWPSFIFIRIRRRCLRSVLDRAHALAPREERGGALFRPSKSFHISLSRRFHLRHLHIEPFLNDLALTLGVASKFYVQVGGSKPFVLSNDEETRHFLCLSVADPSSALQQMVSSINNTLKQYRQPQYYDDPIFHVSIAETTQEQQGGEGRGESESAAVSRPSEVGESESESSSDEDEDEEEEEEEEEAANSDQEGKNAGSNVHDLPSSILVTVIRCNIGHRRFRFDLSVPTGAGAITASEVAGAHPNHHYKKIRRTFTEIKAKPL